MEQKREERTEDHGHCTHEGPQDSSLLHPFRLSIVSWTGDILTEGAHRIFH
ncbi:hypothetical protein ACRRTK_004428 [Alexandromys fortis]